jgi:choline-sulfatase
MKISRRDFLKSATLYMMGLLGLSMQSGLKRLNETAGDTPNVIILVFDTLSARHLSLYGYGRLTSPNLARFAQKATVYHRHYAAGNFTSPGTASLLTGTYPWTHRAFQQGGVILRSLADRNMFGLINGSYEKAAFAQNIWADMFLYQFEKYIDVHVKSTAYSLEEQIHYNDGLWKNDPLIAFRSFEDFLEQDYGIPGSLYFSFFDKFRAYLANEYGFRELRKEYPRGIPNFIKYKMYFLLEKVVDGVAQEISDLHEPFIGYYHFWSPHEPYFPHRRFIGMFDDGWNPAPKTPHPLSSDASVDELNRARREYDEYVANVDAEFGRLYDYLQGAGILDNSYLIVTSDHGQMFERGVNGHVTPLLPESIIRIPLLISAPGQSSRMDTHSPTSCVDILPTLLKITGDSAPVWLEGKLLPGFGAERLDDHPVFAVEAKKNPSRSPLTEATLAMIQGDYKLIWYIGYPGYDQVYELYDLASDPEELVDLSESHSDIALSMGNELKTRLAQADQPYRVKV